MSARVARRRRHAQRGLSLSAFVVVSVLGLILIAGLVIDGGQQLAATRRAESTAAAAARAGANAAAGEQLGGGAAGPRAIAAAQAVLDASGVAGQVRLIDGRVRVDTSVTAPTIFLSILGYDAVTGHGSATAEVVRS